MTQCATCGADPCANPGFCVLCRKSDERFAAKRNGEDPAILRARRLLDDSISLERAYREFNTLRDRAAESTVEALMFDLRAGVKALEQSAVRRRLSELNEAQVRAVGVRLQRLMPAIAKAWDADAVVRLISKWAELKNG